MTYQSGLEVYQKSLQYTIRNQSGQQVYQSNSAQPVSRIDMSALPSGMYILTVVGGEGAPVSWRIMKN